MSDKKEMCGDCASLIRASRHTSPHSNLVLVDSHKCSSIMGAADETNYRCSVCGHEWLRETGSCGMGWVG